MPWRLIAKAFGWRIAADEDGETPVLVVWHPRLRRHSPAPTLGGAPCAYPSTRRSPARLTSTERRLSHECLVAVDLLMHMHHYPESAIACALDGILTPGMRKHAGIDSARGIAGDDVASSIAAVSLPDDNTPEESAFPLWPVRTER